MKKNWKFLKSFGAAFGLWVSTLLYSQISYSENSPSPALRTLTEPVGKQLACPGFDETFWNSLYRVLEDRQTFPSPLEARAEFETVLKSRSFATWPKEEKAKLLSALLKYYSLLTQEVARTLQTMTTDRPDSLLAALTGLEIGDRSTPEMNALQDKIESLRAKLKAFVRSDCLPEKYPESVATTAAGELLDNWKRTRHPVVYGGLKAFATAYQSCDAATRPALSSAESDIQGISIIGWAPDGIGRRRVISDLSSVLRTHPYLLNHRPPSSNRCFNVRSKPLIYDYGGKPSTTSSMNSTLNFFADAGSGTKELGIDCSGYVYSALASAGLRIKKNAKMKAVTVHGIPARMYMNPQRNGLTCMDHVRFHGSESLRAGDIMATRGHIVIIEKAGSDPFGIRRFNRESECSPENISTDRFDFTILQSSPIKAGIGIDRAQAAWYLSLEDHAKLAEDLIKHAVNACRAHTTGQSVSSRTEIVSIVRHSASRECRDREIPLDHQECLASCSAN